MEERLIEIVRLCTKYALNIISITLKHNETSIAVSQNDKGNCRRIKSKCEDHKLIEYLCLLANINVNDSQYIPQTKEFELVIDDKNIKFRIAIISSAESINCILKILNQEVKNIDDDIKYVQYQLTNMVNKQYGGLIVLSGPTGSGKTTTAYSLLKQQNNAKIYSVEDPIEVYIDNVIQIAVSENTGLDVKEAVKQISRHNVDLLFIGECRDSDALNAAINAAARGTIVLTTMHASSCEKAIGKMQELCNNKDLLKKVLTMVTYQKMDIIDKKKVVSYKIMDYIDLQHCKLLQSE